MSEIDPIGSGLTGHLVGVALDAALARHAAIASNIANAGTVGYRPLAARFDELVHGLQGRVLDRSSDSSTARILQSVEDSLQRQPVAADPRSSTVELDMQMAELAKNTLQYQALLTAQGKLMALQQLVIGEGKL